MVCTRTNNYTDANKLIQIYWHTENGNDIGMHIWPPELPLAFNHLCPHPHIYNEIKNLTKTNFLEAGSYTVNIAARIQDHKSNWFDSSSKRPVAHQRKDHTCAHIYICLSSDQLFMVRQGHICKQPMKKESKPQNFQQSIETALYECYKKKRIKFSVLTH